MIASVLSLATVKAAKRMVLSAERKASGEDHGLLTTDNRIKD